MGPEQDRAHLAVSAPLTLLYCRGFLVTISPPEGTGLSSVYLRFIYLSVPSAATLPHIAILSCLASLVTLGLLVPTAVSTRRQKDPRQVALPQNPSRGWHWGGPPQKVSPSLCLRPYLEKGSLLVKGRISAEIILDRCLEEKRRGEKARGRQRERLERCIHKPPGTG